MEKPILETEGADALRLFFEPPVSRLIINRDEMLKQQLAELVELRCAIDAIYTVLEPEIVMAPWYGLDEPKHKKILRILPKILSY